MPTQPKANTHTFITSDLVKQQNTSSRPIGVFDSGIGGLSIMHCIKQQLPNENLLYVADTLNAPYGEKSTVFIQQRVNDIADWFVAKNAKAIVVACNTATVSAIDQLRQNLAIPVIGVEPAIKPAAQQSKQKKVAILVTKTTAENQRFLALVQQYSNTSEIYIQACPGLVELIEQDKKNSLDCELMLTAYLQPLIEKGVDTIVLGCTHYPLVTSLIHEICGNNITIMETAQPVTEQLQRQLIAHQLINLSTHVGSATFYSSQNSISQQQLFSHIWQQSLSLHKFP
ncbi:glutamate racemase [Cognaticolwellia mytili]|uniref:glutamate racemase n=1 Tax=Cognaticolwellia mytili TaxID=1888913 RepID=UPI000A174F09|nr:glutamate racemase [Cognaticolwellia mytili]